MDDISKEEQELITIAGGVEMEVSYSGNGTKEMVKVRQVPISQIARFVMALTNEAEAIELYCDKPKGWADTLSVESANAIADKGQELNLPFFAAWFKRQMKWRESQGPLSMITGTPEGSQSGSPSALASSAPVSPTITT